MSPAISRLYPRRATRLLLALMAAVAIPCHSQDEPSLFAGSGTTPAELGRTLVWQLAIGAHPQRPGQDGLEPDPFPLVVLPATTAERQELLDSLKQKGDFPISARQRLFVAMLLEGWGRADEALGWLESEGDPSTDPLHLVRLRYRSGDPDGAAAAFAAAQEWDKSGMAGSQALQRRTAEWLRPFVAMDLYPDLAKFLEWLQPQCRTTAFRSEVLQLRLNVAYQQGKIPGLLDQLATAPPPLRDLANWLLSHDPATLPERLDELAPGDLLLFHRVSPQTPALDEAMRRLIVGGRGTAAERSELLFDLLRRASGENNPLLALWFERDSEVLALLDAALPALIRQGATWLPTKPITALADRHPDHPAVNLLAGMAVKAWGPVYAEPREVPSFPAHPYLLRACNAPMIETAADEPMAVNQLLPWSQLDGVGTALAALSETLPPRRLFETVTKHPGFTKLQTRDKARYLALAKLDVPFLETLLTVDWSDPANDRCGAWAGNYLAGIKSSRLPDQEWMARFRTALPAMLIGSAKKPPERIRSDTLSARGIFADTPSQDADFRALLAEVTRRLPGDAGRLLEEAAAATPAAGSVRSRFVPSELAYQIGWFAPSRMVRWVDQGLRNQAPSAMMNDRSPWSLALASMGARYPVLVSPESPIGNPRLPTGLRSLPKLRTLLPPDSPHATAMDLAIVAGRLPAAPGEIADMAKTHLAALIKEPRQLDFILLRIHSNLRPGTPPDWSPLANLTDAPFSVRQQAADLLDRSGNPGQSASLAKLRTRLLGAATPPKPPVSQDRAAYERLHRARGPGGKVGPEEVRLAEEVLRAYLARGGRETSPTENVAISVLVDIGRFESFLKEVATACRARPDGEAACAKAMHALHQYTILHKNGESLAFARQVLAVDPDDLPAARQCVWSALATGDHAMLLAALPALRKGEPRSFAETLMNPRLPLVMPHAAAPRLLEIMTTPSTLDPTPPPRIGGSQLADLKRENVENLHLFFHELDPSLAARCREWILANGWYPPSVTVPALVNALCEDRLKQDATALIAATITGTKLPADDGPPLRFAAVADPLFQLKPAARAAFDAAVAANLCRETLDLLPATDDLAGPRALLRYANSPTPETYRSELVALLDKLPAAKRQGADGRLASLLESMPAAAEHRLMAVPADTPPDRLPLPDAYTHRSTAAWDLPALRAAWQRSRASASAADKPPDARAIFSLTPAMVEFADESLWTDYAPELLKAIPEAKDLQGLVRMLPMISRPELKPRLTPILQAMTGATNAMGFHQIVQAAWLLDDEATLTAVEQRLKNPPDNWMNRDLKPLAQALLARKDQPELIQPTNQRNHEPAAPPAIEVPILATPGPGIRIPKRLSFPSDHRAPVTGLFLAGTQPVTLANLPWQPGQELTLTAWVLSCGGAQLELQALDANDTQVKSIPLTGSDGDRGIPTWRQLNFTLAPRESAAAEKLNLVARRKGGDWVLDRAPALWLTKLRFAATDTDQPPPAAVPVGRLAGDITAMNCTPDGSFLAIGLRDGRVAVMETATAAVGFFSPKRAGPVAYVAIGGRHLLSADAANSLRLMDLENRTIRRLGTLTTPADHPGPAQLGMTPDGDWLVWCDRKQDVRIARLDSGDLGRPVTLAVGAKPSFIIDHRAVLVSGASGHFRIPYTDLPTLAPADLQPLATAPEPQSAVRTSGPDGLTWTIPARQLHVRANGTNWSFNARDRTIRLPTTSNKVAVAATGTVFYATACGRIYQLDPVAVEAGAPPPLPDEEPEE